LSTSLSKLSLLPSAALAAVTAVLISSCATEPQSTWGRSSVGIEVPTPVGVLVPGASLDPVTGNMVGAVFTGLTNFRGARGTPSNAAAQTIESADQLTWLVTLRKDWTFHDGSPMTADSFINAWNYVAYGPHRQVGADLLSPILGYDAMTGEAPSATTLAGLAKTSELEFTITLSAPNSQFPVLLATPAYSPLPAAFFEDPAEFAQNPIGNGPYQVVEGSSDGSLKLTRFGDYLGTRGKVDRIDVAPASPPGDEAESGRNSAAVRQGAPGVPLLEAADSSAEASTEVTTGTLTTLGFPLYNPRFANADVRAAISMAIDRDVIVADPSRAALAKASGWVSPVANGYRANGCGANCTYNFDKANSTLSGAGGFDGDLQIAYLADGAQAALAESICTSIRNTLDLACSGRPFPDEPAMAAALMSNQLDGPFLTRRNMTYPSIQDFLVPTYTTGGTENWTRYSNPFFDAIVAQADASNPKESLAAYQNAETVLAAEMPSAPLWFEVTSLVHSGDYGNVGFTPYAQVNLPAISQR
jgi:oligopeptide transport system substrate-binding protein